MHVDDDEAKTSTITKYGSDWQLTWKSVKTIETYCLQYNVRSTSAYPTVVSCVRSFSWCFICSCVASPNVQGIQEQTAGKSSIYCSGEGARGGVNINLPCFICAILCMFDK